MKRLLISRREFAMIFTGILILAIGIQWFLVPHDLVTGGISGFGMIIDSLVGIPIPVTNIVVNIPLFVISIKQRGVDFAVKAFYSVILLSILLSILEMFANPFVELQDMVLVAVFGAAAIGLGVGIVLKAGASTGGTDMLATIIHFIMPKVPISTILLCIDGSIIAGGMFLYGVENTMYAIIAVVIISRVISRVLEGGTSAIAAYIISDKSDEIAKAIIEVIPRGCTQFVGKGMYSGQERKMLFTVVAEKQLPQLKELINQIDSKAFITVGEVRETLGEGFMPQ
ncbi:MAG: hypothetical protein ATN35_07315 [Epulopiscium sp. Nele67-Bin004]|nr:MAG: hypothetical protein ATN35_07315 [Epulopiscium sp. Nele67-Bin004]